MTAASVTPEFTSSSVKGVEDASSSVESVADAARSAPDTGAAVDAAKQEPTVLYARPNAFVLGEMAFDGVDLFWMEVHATEGLQVRAASKQGGGPVRTLGRWYDFTSDYTLALDDGYAYWLRDADADIVVVKVPKQGGTETVFPLPLKDDGSRIGYEVIEEAEGYLWILDAPCSHAARMNKDGSDVRLWHIVDVQYFGGVTGVTVRDGMLYCRNGPNIHELDTATGMTRDIVTEQQRVGPLLWLGDELYFQDNHSITRTGETLRRLEPDGSVTEIGPSFGMVPRFAYDEPNHTLFWMRGYHRSTAGLGRYVIGSNTTELLRDDLDMMGGFVLDADYLYWLGDSDVYRMPKP
jgi:hypothetical protein